MTRRQSIAKPCRRWRNLKSDLWCLANLMRHSLPVNPRQPLFKFRPWPALTFKTFVVLTGELAKIAHVKKLPQQAIVRKHQYGPLKIFRCLVDKWLMAIPTATTEQIRALMAEAALASDTRTYNVCARALDGSARAIKLVSRMIYDARAETVLQEARALAASRVAD